MINMREARVGLFTKIHEKEVFFMQKRLFVQSLLKMFQLLFFTIHLNLDILL